MGDSQQNKPIVNEFLAFLQRKNKLVLEGAMDAKTAVQMNSRASSFTIDDICEAKQVLCQSLGIAGTYVPHRRGDENGQKTLEDIKKILRENQDRIPEFVATASCIPENLDISSLFKEIEVLKTSLAEMSSKFEASLITIADLRNEIACLRNVPTQPAASNFERDSRPDTRVKSVRLPVDAVKSVASAAPPPARPPRVQPPAPSSLRQRSYASVTGRQPAADRVSIPSKKCESRALFKEKSSRTNVDTEGFTLVERKSKARRAPRKTVSGTADPGNSGLRVATPSKPLYVSRLHYSTVADEVVEYASTKPKIDQNDVKSK
ncbi:uncharacterized protein LOC125239556 [Leguminivora glycinivorella]|uniref:uncharacterized protein LOC125239556 n=1 Tax=Leguminivora glycinivorella TaxID=1035111 RepID=UPI00200C86FA|nr:uncharacterized protein LOC125239556 [Leguminivora glycinivorella]